MRFKAQDGQFVLANDQVVTVTGTTDDEGDWLNVTGQQGASGSVPAGFLVQIEPDHHQEETQQLLDQAIPAVSKEQSPDPLKPSNDPIQLVTASPQPHQAEIPNPIENPSSNNSTNHMPIPASPSVLATSLPASRPTTLASVASRDAPSPSSQPLPTPSKVPPPPAAKPNALRDRIAMFNKPAPAASSPPPNLRPKPPLARKPLNIPPPAPPIQDAQSTQTSTSASNQDGCVQSTEPSGMSAADAEESVKAGGSLKDRIRLLQQQQQQQQLGLASDSSLPASKPKREWKRPPPAPTDELHPISIAPPPGSRDTPGAGETIADPRNEVAPSSAEVDTASAEVTEDDDDIARRRRIAERMAKLGGAKMGFGLPGLLTKPSLPQHSSDESSQAPEEPQAEELSALPPERIVMPTIPRRAAPPRRKAPAPAPSPSALDPSLQEQPPPVPTPDEQTQPLLKDCLPQKDNNVEERPVPDASSLTIEPSGNASQSSDANRPEPSYSSTQDMSVQSQECLASDQLSQEPAQDFEYVPIPSEKDPGENNNAPENLLHEEQDLSNGPAHAPRQNTIGSSSSVEPNLPPQLSHEIDQSGSGIDHQLAAQEVPLMHPSLDQMAPSSQTAPHTSGLPPSDRDEEERVSSYPPHESKPLLNPEELAHDSIGIAAPSSLPILNHLEEHVSELAHSPATLTNKPSEAETQAHVLSSEANPGPTAYKPESLPLSPEMASLASSAPPSESPAVKSSAQRADDDNEVESEASAPYLLDSQPSDTQVNEEPVPVQAASATIPETDLTGDVIDKVGVEHPPTDDEDEEVARRRRITERLAKVGGRSMMGGVSPHRPLPELPAVQSTPITQEEPSDTIEASENQPTVTTEDNQSEDPQVDINETDDDDDAARRRRIAERMAKMGGRSMMGGMVPMFFQQSAGNATSPSKNPPTVNQAPSPAQPTRALPPATHPPKSATTHSYSAPSPPQRAVPAPTIPEPAGRLQESPPIPPNRPWIASSAVHPPSRSSTDSYLTPSPPQRVAPVPTFPDHTDRPQQSPPIPPNRPEGMHSTHSAAAVSPHRPRIPNAYSSPKRSSILSQSSLTRPADDHPASPVEAYPETSLSAPYESGVSLASTPPTRVAPHLPTSSPSALVIPKERMDHAGFTFRRHGEPESNTGLDSTFDSELQHEAVPDDSESEAYPPVLAQQHEQAMMNSFKARDLDIASERWWRSRPVAPPSSVTLLDDVLIRLQGTSSLNRGVTTSQYELIVIRDDYSKTVVNVKFGDNSEDESSTELTQSHYPPPEPYDISKLQALSHSLGPQLVSRAKAKEDEKGFKGVEGSSFVKTIIQSLGNALEPVGSTFGQLIYHCDVIHDSKGPRPEIRIKDDVRPGDIVASYGASFKGKGIGHNSMTLGSLLTPHAGVVSENDIKKNKFKAFGVFNGKVELLSYRLDELKSGSIVVYRVLDKSFLD